MFDWLASEIDSIGTRKFHVTEGADGQLAEVVAGSELGLAESYKSFVMRFRGARFFRQSFLGYKLGVVASPRKVANDLYAVGYEDGKAIRLRQGSDRVFRANSGKAIAPSFESWLEGAYQRMKSAYSPMEWSEIENGPPNFDARELALVEARGRFMWREAGVSQNGDRLLEVRNNSSIRIPCLSIGVRAFDGNLNGAVVVEVGDLLPQMTEVFALDCYKKIYAPSDLVLFDLPNPGPEDRVYLAELKRPWRSP